MEPNIVSHAAALSACENLGLGPEGPNVSSCLGSIVGPFAHVMVPLGGLRQLNPKPKLREDPFQEGFLFRWF